VEKWVQPNVTLPSVTSHTQGQLLTPVYLDLGVAKLILCVVSVQEAQQLPGQASSEGLSCFWGFPFRVWPQPT
jgi:hypothetical protein